MALPLTNKELRPGTTTDLQQRSKVIDMQVSQLWRYPVKSMIGEQINSIDVTGNGVAGDRIWATRDLSVAGSAEQEDSTSHAMRISTPRRRPC